MFFSNILSVSKRVSVIPNILDSLKTVCSWLTLGNSAVSLLSGGVVTFTTVIH